MSDFDRLTRASAFRLASELALRLANAVVTETYPATTGKDGLRVSFDAGPHRNDLLVHSMIDWVVLPDGEQIQGGLSAATQPGRMRALIDEVLSRCGRYVPAERPSALAVMYRTVAAALTARLFDELLWDARTISVDAGPVTPRDVDHLPGELDGAPGSAVWRLTAGGEPVAVLTAGRAWTMAGDVVDLLAEFGAGASYGDLASRISRRHLR